MLDRTKFGRKTQRKLRFLSCKDIPDYLLNITGLYLRIAQVKMLLIIFSRAKSMYVLALTEKYIYIYLSFAIIGQKNVRLNRINIDLEANNLLKELKCVFILYRVLGESKIICLFIDFLNLFRDKTILASHFLWVSFLRGKSHEDIFYQS